MKSKLCTRCSKLDSVEKTLKIYEERLAIYEENLEGYVRREKLYEGALVSYEICLKVYEEQIEGFKTVINDQFVELKKQSATIDEYVTVKFLCSMLIPIGFMMLTGGFYLGLLLLFVLFLAVYLAFSRVLDKN